MAIDQSKFADLASRLIGENGRSVTFVKFSRTPESAGEPWKGPDPTANTEVTLTAVFVEPGSIEDLGFTATDEAGTLVRAGVKFALVSAKDAAANELETFDEVHDGAQVWKIMEVGKLQPGTVEILYQVQLESKV